MGGSGGFVIFIYYILQVGEIGERGVGSDPFKNCTEVKINVGDYYGILVEVLV